MNIYRIRKRQRRAPILSALEMERVHRSIDRHSVEFERDRALLALSFFSGLRAKELAMITISVLVDEEGRLRRSTVLPGSMTKGDELGEIYMEHPEARADLQAYIDSRLGNGATVASRLFVSHRGGTLSPDSMRQLLKAIFQRAGIKATSHSGRRTFATSLDQAGLSLREIQELMRHRSWSTTLRYIEVNPVKLAKAVAAIKLPSDS